MTPLHGATGAGYGEGFAANNHRNHPAGFMPAVRYLVEECGADVNARDSGRQHAASQRPPRWVTSS